MWIILRNDLYDIADDTLENQIDDVRHFLEAQGNNVSSHKLRDEIEKVYGSQHSGAYLQIQDDQGTWIYRAQSLEKDRVDVSSFSELRMPLYEDREINGHHLRFLSAILDVRGHRFLVTTGVPEGDILRTLKSLRRNLLLSALVILVVSSAVGFWLSRKALAPVDAITRTARVMNVGNLSSRLQQLNTGDELQRLSETLNEMLSRIESSFQRVSQFTADASHELRTPISLMRTEAEIALKESRGEAEYQDALRHILSEAEKTSTLIDKLLSLARADSGRESLDLQPLNLKELIVALVNDWHQIVSGHGLTLEEDILGDDLFISGDRIVIVRLVNILIDNAVKYTPKDGKIAVTLRSDHDFAILTVQDSGIGISSEDQIRIFERFYRADKARSREIEGVGLGLAIAQWIVDQHGGSITVQSFLGKGSRFAVRLPMVPEMAINLKQK